MAKVRPNDSGPDRRATDGAVPLSRWRCFHDMGQTLLAELELNKSGAPASL